MQNSKEFKIENHFNRNLIKDVNLPDTESPMYFILK